MATSRIKGITVEIGGDTTKLQTALKSVNTEIRNTQSELRDVNKLLKLDPGNTELLTQKHKLLGSVVQETKEKLATLKTAAEQANTALANGEISQSQYDALQREIIETEQKLKDLETQANQSSVALQKIAATGTKFQEVGSKISSVGQSLLPVSAAVTGIGFLNMASPTDAVAAAMDKIGLTVTDANGNFKDMDTILSEMRSGMEGMTEAEKENVIATIAGKNAVSGLMSVVNMSQEEYDALASSMDNCSGIAGETASVMQDNLQSKVEQLGGALESLAIKLSDYVIPFLTSLVEKITAAVDWFTNLNPVIQQVILVVAGIIAVAGPLLIIVGKVISAVGTILTVIPKLAGVINTVNAIKSVLHFSVPDEGPLTDYEDWMPDFMEGLAKGIEKSRGLVQKAVNDAASDMVITPQVGGVIGSDGYSTSGENTAGLVSSISAAVADALKGFSGQTGDIVIPVYVGGTLFDEAVVSAQARMNLKSGGR